MCGGTREALAIRRTLLDRQCSRACEIVLSVWSYQSINPLPPDQAPSPQTLLPQHAPANGASIKKSILATFVITTCYSDLKPGSEFELLLATFVIATCYADLHQNGDFWLPLATFVITACYCD